jgi:hypothetical protein
MPLGRGLKEGQGLAQAESLQGRQRQLRRLLWGGNRQTLGEDRWISLCSAGGQVRGEGARYHADRSKPRSATACKLVVRKSRGKKVLLQVG